MEETCGKHYVQYGCGLCAPPNWVNFDVSPTLRLQRLPIIGVAFAGCGTVRFPKNSRYGDIVRGLPLPPGSCLAAYCSHTLEHLSLDDLRAALRNTLRLLAPGGTVRLVLPDLEGVARAYLDSPAADAANTFMAASYLGLKSRPRGLGAVVRALWGHSSHLWMWDYKSLRAELESAGFVAIRRAHLGDNPDPHFRQVENLGRWEGFLGMECHAPARGHANAGSDC